MKRSIFIMLALLAIAFAGPMLIKKPDGTPFMEIPFVEKSSNASGNFSVSGTSGSNQSFYKWQDDDGTWHYSDTPPEGKAVKTITVDTNTNLIQGLKIEKHESNNFASESKGKADSVNEESSAIPLPMTMPIEKVTEMLKDAHNIQNVIDNRAKQIEQATGG